MIQESGKYLYTPYVRDGGGLDSYAIDLIRLIQAALATQRIPIIMKGFSGAEHRWDRVNKTALIDWDRYFNLAKTQLVQVEPHGGIKRLPDTLKYVYEQDFDFDSYSKAQIRSIDYTQVRDKENENYPIVCLLNREDNLGAKESPKLNQKIEGILEVDFGTQFLVILSFAKLVNDLTDVVLNHFGTTRQDMELLSSILYDLPVLRYADAALYDEGFSYYACMHIRHTDSHKLEPGKSYANLNRYVKRVVRIMYARNYKSMPLYIMSNISDAHYFDFLKPRYDVYRYTDFEEFRERFSSKEEIDHNLLYLVEQNIMSHAAVKGFASHRNNFIFDYPWLNIRANYEKIIDELVWRLRVYRDKRRAVIGTMD